MMQADRTAELQSLLTHRILILDGAMGTMIQQHKLGELRDQWLLVSVAPAACDETCQNNLYLQRQLRESLGKEK